MKALLLLIVLATITTCTSARDRTVRAEFQRLNPCPSTSERRGPCPGWVGDHIIPLCAGGADSTENMQWQPLEASRLKDVQERAHCRKLQSP